VLTRLHTEAAAAAVPRARSRSFCVLAKRREQAMRHNPPCVAVALPFIANASAITKASVCPLSAATTVRPPGPVHGPTY
jgi:hypothetical protein